MRGEVRKIAAVVGVVSVLCVGYTALAMPGDMSRNPSSANAYGTDALPDQEENGTTETEHMDEETGDTELEQEEPLEGRPGDEEATEDTSEQDEVTETVIDEQVDIYQDSPVEDQVEKQEETDPEESDNRFVFRNLNGISYYLDMKKNETLADLYQEIDTLLVRKLDIYKALKESGEITEITLKQVEAQEKQMISQKENCEHEAEYNRFILSQLKQDFDDVNIKEMKNVGTIESCLSGQSGYDTLSIARYVTDCKNAVSNIKAKEVEKEVLTVVSDQTQLLKDMGEASELDVIDSKVAVLKVQLELESEYYNMNAAYYSIGQNTP